MQNCALLVAKVRIVGRLHNRSADEHVMDSRQFLDGAQMQAWTALCNGRGYCLLQQ